MKHFSTFFILGVLGAALALSFPFYGLAQAQPESAPEPFFEEEKSEREEFVEPREIKDALRQLNDITRETQRVLKKAQKSTGFAQEVGTLQGLLSEANTHSNAIRNASGGANQREALQDFYDTQLWDTLNEIRIKIEFPQELKSIERDLKRLEKLISGKRFSIENVDVSVITAKVQEIKNAVSEARTYFNEGNFEDARDALSVVHEGSHPGEMYGVVQQLRDIGRRLKSIKKEVRDGFYEVLSPVYEAVNDGDFREANMLLGDIGNDLWRLLDRAKGRSVKNEDIQERLRKLEESLQVKQQQREQEEFRSEPQSKGSFPYQPHQASALEGAPSWLRGLFGF